MKYILEPINKVKEKTVDPNLYSDIRLINQWPDEMLVKQYDQAKSRALMVEKESDKMGLLNEQKEELDKKYDLILRTIERLEDEGRKRQILYFLPWEQVLKICQVIFNSGQKYKLVKNGGTPPKQSLEEKTNAGSV